MASPPSPDQLADLPALDKAKAAACACADEECATLVAKSPGAAVPAWLAGEALEKATTTYNELRLCIGLATHEIVRDLAANAKKACECESRACMQKHMEQMTALMTPEAHTWPGVLKLQVGKLWHARDTTPSS